MNQSESAQEFELLFDCFRRECQKNLARLKTVKENKEQHKLFMQLNYICKQIDELTPTLEYLKKDDYSSENTKRYIEDQRRFKKVLCTHLQDLNNFLSSALI
ncbi:MAG: hypothetical protein JW956_11335 [Calditrichaceae bacterium]|nr:hypothetical protein [Calditrichaceae bacterium]